MQNNIEITIDRTDFKAKLGLKDGQPGPKGDTGSKGDTGMAGKDGETGPRGLTGVDGSPDSPKDIRDKLKELKGKDRLPASAIHGLPELSDRVDTMNQVGYATGGANPIIIKNQGIRVSEHVTEVDFSTNLSAVYSGDGKVTVTAASSGLSSVSHDATLSGDGTAGDPLSVIGGGGGFTKLVFTGDRDGTNVTFTTTAKPEYVVSDGAWYTQLDDNGVTQWDWDGVNTVTMIIPPNGSIYGFK